MSLLTDAAAGILTPEELGNLVLRPIQQTSVALQVCIVVRPTALSSAASRLHVSFPVPFGDAADAGKSGPVAR